jgi:hypothetical protein
MSLPLGFVAIKRRSARLIARSIKQSLTIGSYVADERPAMRLKVEMMLNDNTAQRFKETAERLVAMNIGDDGLLAATVLMRIAANYERAAAEARQSIQVEDLSAQNDE